MVIGMLTSDSQCVSYRNNRGFENRFLSIFPEWASSVFFSTDFDCLALTGGRRAPAQINATIYSNSYCVWNCQGNRNERNNTKYSTQHEFPVVANVTELCHFKIID